MALTSCAAPASLSGDTARPGQGLLLRTCSAPRTDDARGIDSMTVTAARRTMSPRRTAARTAAVAALSAAALLGGGLTAQAAAPARATGAAVELAPAGVLRRPYPPDHPYLRTPGASPGRPRLPGRRSLGHHRRQAPTELRSHTQQTANRALARPAPRSSAALPASSPSGSSVTPAAARTARRQLPKPYSPWSATTEEPQSAE